MANPMANEPLTKPIELPSTSTGRYNLIAILDRKKQNKKPQSHIQDLQVEIKTIKLEIQQLKAKQKDDSKAIQFLLATQKNEEQEKNHVSESDEELDPQVLKNIIRVLEEFLHVLREITTQKIQDQY